MDRSNLCVNLGGEGEIAHVINQQGPWVLSPNWVCSRDGRTLNDLVADGHDFLICPNLSLPFPNDSVTFVYTNGVPIYFCSLHGPGVQSSEIRRILKPGGRWIKDGKVEWTKP